MEYKNEDNSKLQLTKNKYPALEIISKFYNGFAILIGGATLVLAYNFRENDLFLFATLILGALLCTGVKAVSEGIHVAIDIELNSRNEKHEKILMAQLELLSSIAEKAGVPLEDINQVTAPFEIEFVE